MTSSSKLLSYDKYGAQKIDGDQMLILGLSAVVGASLIQALFLSTIVTADLQTHSARSCESRMAGGAGREEPATKRVRFENNSSNAQLTSAGCNHRLNANDVIELRFVTHRADIDSKGAGGQHSAELTAHPTFTHQVFPEGAIYGFHSATAALYYTCGSLHCWLDVSAVPAQSYDNGSGSADRCAKEDHGAEQRVQSASNSGTAARTTDIRGGLTKFIHAGLVENDSDFVKIADEDKKYCPPFDGKPVVTYFVGNSEKRDSDTGGRRQFSIFKVSLTSSAEITEYHKRMQLLMFLHIDGANFVDDTDPRWELFVVLEHILGAPRYLVGYATVYPFSAMRPGGKLDAGFVERIRVSQVFILPRYQRGGHGSRLLSAIYEDAIRRRALEVTVEDPSEGFRLLRDITDLRRAYRTGVIDCHSTARIGVGDDAAEDSALGNLRKQLLLTKTQARRCLEIHRLRFVDRNDEVEYKGYRLWVKRRLYEEYLEVLDAYSGQERKTKLGEIYDDYEKEYLRVVDRLRDFKP